MAEIFGPYDPASPCPTTFCKRISVEDFERQGSVVTQQAIAELIEYLEYNPTAYHNIVRKRKREDEENSGVLSWLKVKMLSKMFGDDYCETMDDDELKQKMTSLKNEMISSYNYAEEAKGSGRRFSRRIANRCRGAKENSQPNMKYYSGCQTSANSNDLIIRSLETDLLEAKNTPQPFSSNRLIPMPPELPSVIPPPPPPPPVPASVSLSAKSQKGKVSQSKEPKMMLSETTNVKYRPNTRSQLGIKDSTSKEQAVNDIGDLMASLIDPQIRSSLRPVRNKDFSPYQMRQQLSKNEVGKENDFPLFNQKLITKFQNARSPQTPENSQYLSDVSSPDSFIVSP